MQKGTFVGTPAGQGRSSDQPLANRTILILQGIATPFFAQLARHLSDNGADIHRVHYCGGDWIFRGEPYTGVTHHRFSGKPANLKTFYSSLINSHQIDTIILFGDCRPIHEPARELAQQMGITLYAMDEGYIRPGFITMEQGGTNGFSHMPKCADGVRDLAAKAPPLENYTPMGTDMMRRAKMDIWAHTGNILHRRKFPNYIGHRPTSVWREAMGWVQRAWRSLSDRRANEHALTMITMSDQPYFMVPLQLNSDYQIRVHSRFSGMPEFIDETLGSFAAHAPKDCQLFFKNHPLDNGLIGYRHLINTKATALGIKDRVFFASGGNLNWFLEHCEGVVLVNSTVGFAALKSGTPLKVLGKAIYDIGGLTDQQPLDSFWQNPTSPQQTLAEDFLTVVETYTQVRGDLFSEAGIKRAVNEATQVITSNLPRLPGA